ncbi:MAG: hypothetical protein F6K19_33200 [Cyanothece sp. SIO1E1]|nr:hypothetical protein [Cyanothece sp. SIO1E1]
MDMKQKSFMLIKILSIILITSALGLELWRLEAIFTPSEIPNSLNLVFGFERFALICHLFEGVIAAAYAASKAKKPIWYGAYTFFVGFIGLIELFDPEQA